MLSFAITGSYTDLYELAMSEVFFLDKRENEQACFDYFFRKTPAGGGYVVTAGLGDLLSVLDDFHFSDDDLKFLKDLHFNDRFLEYLKGFQFRCRLYACREGEVVFPNCPIVRVEGNIIEAQMIETHLLNILNFQSLVATKASRMKSVAGRSLLSDFGLRRAQGTGGIMATRAATIGGFQSTSNVYAASLYGLNVVGTMAHSYVESFEKEVDAFRHFAAARPKDCTLLVDTYDTLRSGVPNAVTVAKEVEKRGQRIQAIRLDSGDLAYLSTASRAMLDAAGLPYVKIVVSNQLDEYVIRSLKEQRAPIDIFGVGTRLATGQPDAALDGVYKLSQFSGKPRLKLSESLEKTTLPGIKKVMRVTDSKGAFYGADVISLADEGIVTEMFHPTDPEKFLTMKGRQQMPLLEKVMEGGKRLTAVSSVQEIAKYASERLSLLPAEYKRFENPHIYKVGISRNLMDLRDQLRQQHKRNVNESPNNS